MCDSSGKFLSAFKPQWDECSIEAFSKFLIFISYKVITSSYRWSRVAQGYPISILYYLVPNWKNEPLRVLSLPNIRS